MAGGFESVHDAGTNRNLVGRWWANIVVYLSLFFILVVFPSINSILFHLLSFACVLLLIPT